jgi:hypothetical protein
MSRKSKAQGHSRGKRRTSKSRVTDKLHLDSTTDHTAAIVAHSKALKQHSQAITEMTGVLANVIAALAAVKPHKTLNEITADVMECMSKWLVSMKGISKNDSTNPTKNMSTDFHLGGPQEMQLCLEWVRTCLAGKSDMYHLDTTSPNANHHFIALLKGTLGAVVNDVVQNTS